MDKNKVNKYYRKIRNTVLVCTLVLCLVCILGCFIAAGIDPNLFDDIFGVFAVLPVGTVLLLCSLLVECCGFFFVKCYLAASENFTRRTVVVSVLLWLFTCLIASIGIYVTIAT